MYLFMTNNIHTIMHSVFTYNFAVVNIFTLAYKGLLTCGNDQIRHQRLSLKLPNNNLNMIGPADRPWIKRAIDPNHPVVFLDTDGKGWLESDGTRNGAGGPINDCEASIVEKLVLSLSMCGVESSSIGVITPFRSQVSYA